MINGEKFRIGIPNITRIYELDIIYMEE